MLSSLCFQLKEFSSSRELLSTLPLERLENFFLESSWTASVLGSSLSLFSSDFSKEFFFLVRPISAFKMPDLFHSGVIKRGINDGIISIYFKKTSAIYLANSTKCLLYNQWQSSQLLIHFQIQMYMIKDDCLGKSNTNIRDYTEA